ncbi:MAG: hypothetical protein WCQ63_06245 [Methanomethylophilus sp.]
MTLEETMESIAAAHVPEIILILAGLLAFLIVYEYRRDDKSVRYYVCEILGLILGVAMVIITMSSYSEWHTSTCILIVLAAFALMIRPFREADFALFIAILAMVLIYVYLIGLTGDLAFLGEGYTPIIIALVAGALVYGILNFVQKIAQMIGKILNCWPVLVILGLVCIIEAVLILTGYGTIADLIDQYRNGGSLLLL